MVRVAAIAQGDWSGSLGTVGKRMGRAGRQAYHRPVIEKASHLHHQIENLIESINERRTRSGQVGQEPPRAYCADPEQMRRGWVRGQWRVQTDGMASRGGDQCEGGSAP